MSLFSSWGENIGSGIPSLKCSHCQAVTILRKAVGIGRVFIHMQIFFAVKAFEVLMLQVQWRIAYQRTGFVALLQ